MFRLNGTSDILWERKGFTLQEKYAKRLGVEAKYYKNLMELFPDVQFYDYTKIAGRFNKNLPKNYDLTFSCSGVDSYKKQVDFALKKGAQIAVVLEMKTIQKNLWDYLLLMEMNMTLDLSIRKELL